MPDSKQLDILKRLTTHLEAINPDTEDPATSAPYTLDLRGAVARGRTIFGAETPPPFLALLEAPNPTNGEPVGAGKTTRKGPWEILLQGFAVDDKLHPTDPAYALKAQVEQRLSRLIEINRVGDPAWPDEYLLGNRLNGLTIGQGVVRPPEEKVSSTAFFYIPLVLELTTDVTKPYAE